MRKSKNLLAVLVAFTLLLLALACVSINGTQTPHDVAYASSSVDKNFKFNQIDIEINIGKDKIYTVKETLVAEFEDSGINRGIIRDIQRQTTTARYIDGKKVKGKSFVAKLEVVKASYDGKTIKTTIEQSADAYSVYLRKPSGYIEQGEHTFVLEYTYDMSDDKMPGYDDFVFDILGYEMNSTEVFNATLVFPENIDENKVSVRTNNAGYSAVHEWEPNEGESLTVTANTIKISAQPYEANKGYTVQVILPNGYFSEASVTFYWYYLIAIAAVIGGIAIAVFLFLRNSLQGRTVEVLEFYPPEGLSVMEFSSIWHRGAREKDSAALILKWANLGLLTIERDGNKHLILTPTDVYDLKEARLNAGKNKTAETSDTRQEENQEFFVDGDKTIYYEQEDKKYFDNIVEKRFYFKLFSGIGGDGVFSTRILNQASRSTKTKLNEVVVELVKKGNDDENLKDGDDKIKCALPFIGLIPTLSVILYNSVLLGQFLPLFFFIFMAAGTFVGVEWRKNPLFVIMLIFPVTFYGMPYGIFSWMFTLTAYDYIGLLWIAPVIWAVCLFVLPFFIKKRRTGEAQKIYGRLKGFEKFLLTAELPRIQLLFDENPEYFSDILAWCTIMGISEKVQKRFASLNFTMPRYLDEGIQVKWVCGCMHHCHFYGLSVNQHSSISGGSGFSFSSGGGGHGGSFGGGGGGGGSRGC